MGMGMDKTPMRMNTTLSRGAIRPLLLPQPIPMEILTNIIGLTINYLLHQARLLRRYILRSNLRLVIHSKVLILRSQLTIRQPMRSNQGPHPLSTQHIPHHKIQLQAQASPPERRSHPVAMGILDCLEVVGMKM